MAYHPRRSFDTLAELGETGRKQVDLSSAHRRHAIGAFNQSQPAVLAQTR